MWVRDKTELLLKRREEKRNEEKRREEKRIEERGAWVIHTTKLFVG